MLLYFLLGIVFIYIFIPIVDNLLSIFSTWTQYTNYKFVAKVCQIKKKYHLDGEVQNEDSKNSTPIGFSYTEAIGYPQQEEIQIEEEPDQSDKK